MSSLDGINKKCILISCGENQWKEYTCKTEENNNIKDTGETSYETVKDWNVQN